MEKWIYGGNETITWIVKIRKRGLSLHITHKVPAVCQIRRLEDIGRIQEVNKLVNYF